MKILKCLGILILLLIAIHVIAYVEMLTEIGPEYFIMPNIVFGLVLGLYGAYRVVLVIED